MRLKGFNKKHLFILLIFTGLLFSYFFLDIIRPPLCGNLYTSARLTYENDIDYKKFSEFLVTKGYLNKSSAAERLDTIKRPDVQRDIESRYVGVHIISGRKVYNFRLWKPEIYIALASWKGIMISTSSKSGPIFHSRALNNYLVQDLINDVNNQFPGVNLKGSTTQNRHCD